MTRHSRWTTQRKEYGGSHAPHAVNLGSLEAPKKPPKVDRRKKTQSQGQQGVATCPACGGEVKLKKMGSGDHVAGITPRIGTIVYGKHRVGGGNYSYKRGDVVCKMTLEAVKT